MPLTDLQCLNAKPKNKKYKLTDDQGLFLVIMPNGKRYWRYKYRIHGMERGISFGQYPITTLAEARQKRFETQKLIAKGIDPLLVRAEEKQLAKYNAENTFEPVAREWHQFSKFQWQERHAECIMYRLEKYIFPQLGKFPVISITPAMILSCLETVKLTSPDIARRLLQYCRKIFEYANTTMRMSGDPTIGVGNLLPKPKRGHVASIEIDDLPDFLLAVENVRFNVHRQTYLGLRLMLLVFVRHKELRKAKKAEFNLVKRIWTIPGERMKMKLDHLVPLSSQAIAIIEELFALNPNSEYLLPSRTNKNKSISENALLDFVYLAGYKEKMTVHGFRALAMGICLERLKIDFIVIDRQLAHVPESEVRRAYDRGKFWEDRIKLMQRYADYIDGIDPTNPQQRKTIDTERHYSTPKQFAATPNNYGYSARIGYQLSGFAQTMESRAIPEATQGRGEQTVALVETRNHTAL